MNFQLRADAIKAVQMANGLMVDGVLGPKTLSALESNIFTTAEVRRLLDIDSKTVAPRMTNCPNCGAPITSWKCEYCETVFDISRASKAKSELMAAKTRALADSELMAAKTRALADAEEIKTLYENALLAMRNYK